MAGDSQVGGTLGGAEPKQNNNGKRKWWKKGKAMEEKKAKAVRESGRDLGNGGGRRGIQRQK